MLLSSLSLLLSSTAAVLWGKLSQHPLESIWQPVWVTTKRLVWGAGWTWTHTLRLWIHTGEGAVYWFTMKLIELSQLSRDMPLTIWRKSLSSLSSFILTTTSNVVVLPLRGGWLVSVSAVDKTCGWTRPTLLLQCWWIQVRMGAPQGKIIL